MDRLVHAVAPVHGLLLAGGEVQAGEAFEGLVHPGGRGDHVGDVDLHDLVAGARAAVFHVDGERR